MRDAVVAGSHVLRSHKQLNGEAYVVKDYCVGNLLPTGMGMNHLVNLSKISDDHNYSQYFACNLIRHLKLNPQLSHSFTPNP